MTRALVALLTLAACSPERDELHDVDCQGAASDWIEVPERVEMPTAAANTANADSFEVDGQGVVCSVTCDPWQTAGLYLHEQDIVDLSTGAWSPEMDEGAAVALPGRVWAYSANGSQPGDTSLCVITSSSGEDEIEVEVVE